ncbi:MAG TPA: hypothetical protein VD996_00630, partial [Chitinophagaceae bacterium]|nr:hypothetical protein [Chitinophagaceae bacterium]
MEQVKPGQTRSKYYLKLLMKTGAACVLLILLIWAGIYIYFRLNKDELLHKVMATASTRLKGEVKVKDIGLNFFADFPRIMLRLEDVTVHDSLYAVHKQELLKAKKLFVSTRLLEMFSGRIHPSKITIEDGQIFLFTDGNGYSNRYITSPDEGESKRSVSKALPDKIVLKNVSITLYQAQKKKFHDFYVRKLNCKISESGPSMVFKTKLDAVIRNMVFNLEKGSYAKDKAVRGDFNLRFDTVSKALQARNMQLRIGGQPFNINATFNFDSLKNFRLQLSSPKAAFAELKEIVTPAIRKKIDSIDISKPISVSADIAGRTVYRDTPMVTINWKVSNNTIVTPKGNFENASFSGVFTNRVSGPVSRTDENSAIRITGLKASWEGIPIVSEKLTITNLKYPVVTCDIQSNTDLVKLDQVIGTESFAFKKGEARAKIYYHGPLGDSAKVSPYISGSFSFNDADIEYLPRGINMTDFSGDIIFDSSDIRLKDLKGKVQQHPITINAEIRNFFSLLNIDPGKLELSSSVYMPELDV